MTTCVRVLPALHATQSVVSVHMQDTDGKAAMTH